MRLTVIPVDPIDGLDLSDGDTIQAEEFKILQADDGAITFDSINGHIEWEAHDRVFKLIIEEDR